MQRDRERRVVAGTDGSQFGRNAARWAAREAVRRDVPLRIVYADVFALPTLPEWPGRAAQKPDQIAVRDQVEHWLTQATEAAQQEAPEVRVERLVRPGRPVAVLLEESRSAELVVVGDRGFGGFVGLLARSVAVAVAAHGHCPTVVVRHPEGVPDLPDAGPVVAGIDGSPATQRVLDHAFEIADSRAATLQVVHTWHAVGIDMRWIRTGLDSDEVRSSKERLVAECLAGFTEKYPDVELHRFVHPGSPNAELLERARNAQLVVLGTRGHGGFAGMLLGSTSQALIHYAPCPVLVVPAS